jgi:hypothetical protein
VTGRTDANSDRFTLEEALGAMRRLAVAPPEYIEGYADGFNWTRSDRRADAEIAYRRGLKAGRAAFDRGAHRG